MHRCTGAHLLATHDTWASETGKDQFSNVNDGRCKHIECPYFLNLTQLVAIMREEFKIYIN